MLVEQEHSHLSSIDEDYYARVEQGHSHLSSIMRTIMLVLSRNIVNYCRSMVPL